MALLLAYALFSFCVVARFPVIAAADFSVPLFLPAEQPAQGRTNHAICVLVTIDNPTTQTAQVQESLLLFASMLRTGDSLCVVGLGSAAKLVLPLKSIESPGLLASLRTMEFRSGNDLFAAISIAANQLEQVANQTALPHLLLLNFTTLYPTDLELTLNLLCQLQKDGVRFSVIDSAVSDSMYPLSQLAVHGEGEYRFALGNSQLRKQLTRFSARLSTPAPVAAVLRTEENNTYHYRLAQSSQRLLLHSNESPSCGVRYTEKTFSPQARTSEYHLTSETASAQLQLLYPNLTLASSTITLSTADDDTTNQILTKVLKKVFRLADQKQVTEVEKTLATEIAASEQRDRKGVSEGQIRATLKLVQKIFNEHPVSTAQKLLYPLRQSTSDVEGVSDAL